MESRENCIELAERYFACDEVDELRALPVSSQNERFLELWTLKESYLKALGVGLSMPLDGISFSLQPTRGISASANAASWAFMQFQAGSSHLGALCFEDSGMGRTWEARKIIPLVSETGFKLDVRRTSRTFDSHRIASANTNNEYNELMDQ
jgi:4'-phosphopantetheinyl transferase